MAEKERLFVPDGEKNALKESGQRLDKIIKAMPDLAKVDVGKIDRDLQGVRNVLLGESRQGYYNEKELGFVIGAARQIARQKKLGEVKNRIKDLEKKLNEYDLEPEESQELNRLINERDKSKLDMTESYFLQTKYILENGDDDKYLNQLYGKIEMMTKNEKGEKIEDLNRSWYIMKRGLMGQVGVYNFLKKYGMNPELSSPKDDAFNHTDMWGHDSEGNKLMVQGKCSIWAREPLFFDNKKDLEEWIQNKKNDISKDKSKDGEAMERFDRFASKLPKDYDDMDSYLEKNNKQDNTKIVFVILPPKSIDMNTGRLKERQFSNFQPKFGGKKQS